MNIDIILINPQERIPIPKKSKLEMAKEFVATQNQSVRELAASTRGLFSSMGRRGSKSYESTDQTPSDSDEASSSSSDPSGSFNASDLDSSSSEDEDHATPLPQSRKPNMVREDLARSLVGNLVMTPSTRNLLMTGGLDDGEVEDSEQKESIKMHQRQFTIAKKQNSPYGRFTYPLAVISHVFGLQLSKQLRQNTDKHLYKPSKHLYAYVSWTFYHSFLEVFFSFLAIFVVLCVIFALFLLWAANRAPECIVVSGEQFGTNPDTKFYDAFALSWTTFTTVGYGNIYTSTGTDFELTSHGRCSSVVFLCTLEAFVGLLYAGMCAAILFGKVNRVQCHANVEFSNAVCLLYDLETENDWVDHNNSDSDDDIDDDPVNYMRPNVLNSLGKKKTKEASTVGCPVLKFQVVNEHCNKEGGDIVDAFMKVVGVKTKTQNGKITHSQYVRVNLVDSEHPFFSRVWHGIHVLDETSQLLTYSARKKIRENGGIWPKSWFGNPDKIRRKLDYQSLILTMSGTSNLSACTVHAYKRYSFGDLLVGFDFAPLVFFNEEMNSLEVDMSLVHDVKEQSYGTGEDVVKSFRRRSTTLLTESFRGKVLGNQKQFATSCEF
ncbi:hypothetical protein ACHAXN_004774 [Cyclotella atomus]